MLSTRRIGLLCTLATLVVPYSSSAQKAYDSPDGRVEVLGLRRWSLKKLQDAVARVTPGQTLHDAACMVTLRDSLGFADASVVTLTFMDEADRSGVRPKKQYLVIKVVEPQDKSRVLWAAARRDSFKVLRPAYAGVVLAATDSDGGFWAGRLMWPLQFYNRDSSQRAHAIARGGQAAEDAKRLWQFLENQRTEKDFKTATTALRRDGVYANRVVAAMVLANFAERDSTWHALVAALRDPHETVRHAAESVLGNLPARSVEWGPALGDLRAIMAGTNVGAIEMVLELLGRTKISPSHGSALLHKNGYWVLEHLAAENPNSRRAAHSLLLQLNGGRDLGATSADWKRWLSQL